MSTAIAFGLKILGGNLAKNVIITLLEHYAKKSSNTLDDEIVATVKKGLGL